MTPRTLFIIVLRILGLLFIKDILATVPQLLSVIAYSGGISNVIEVIWPLVTILLTLAAYGIVFYYLIFRTDYIIEKLKLDSGFVEETIQVNMHRSTILSIAVIIIGGVLVLEKIPNFFRELFIYFQEKRIGYGVSKPITAGYVILSGLKVILGLVLMVGQRQIVNFIEMQRRKK